MWGFFPHNQYLIFCLLLKFPLWLESRNRDGGEKSLLFPPKNHYKYEVATPHLTPKYSLWIKPSRYCDPAPSGTCLTQGCDPVVARKGSRMQGSTQGSDPTALGLLQTSWQVLLAATVTDRLHTSENRGKQHGASQREGFMWRRPWI